MSEKDFNKMCIQNSQMQGDCTDIIDEIKYKIVLQAIKDYKDCKKAIFINDAVCGIKPKKARKMLLEIESFFWGDWYKMLTNIDGKVVLDELDRQCKQWEVKEDEQQKRIGMTNFINSGRTKNELQANNCKH